MRFSLASLLIVLPTLALADTPSWADPSTTLYMTAPACDYYKCQVTWAAGTKQIVNWLNAPKGNVKIMLESTGSGPSYVVAANVVGTQAITQCDGGNGVGKKGRPCGRYTFTVPTTYQPGQYSIAVYSLTTGAVGYTDIVKVTGSGRTTRSATRNSKKSKSKPKA